MIRPVEYKLCMYSTGSRLSQPLGHTIFSSSLAHIHIASFYEYYLLVYTHFLHQKKEDEQTHSSLAHGIEPPPPPPPHTHTHTHTHSVHRSINVEEPKVELSELEGRREVVEVMGG